MQRGILTAHGILKTIIVHWLGACKGLIHSLLRNRPAPLMVLCTIVGKRGKLQLHAQPQRMRAREQLDGRRIRSLEGRYRWRNVRILSDGGSRGDSGSGRNRQRPQRHCRLCLIRVVEEHKDVEEAGIHLEREDVQLVEPVARVARARGRAGKQGQHLGLENQQALARHPDDVSIEVVGFGDARGVEPALSSRAQELAREESAEAQKLVEPVAERAGRERRIHAEILVVDFGAYHGRRPGGVEEREDEEEGEEDEQRTLGAESSTLAAASGDDWRRGKS